MKYRIFAVVTAVMVMGFWGILLADEPSSQPAESDKPSVENVSKKPKKTEPEKSVKKEDDKFSNGEKVDSNTDKATLDKKSDETDKKDADKKTDEKTAEKKDVAPKIMVTATKIQEPKDHVAGAITIITAEDIERKGVQWVSDALRSVPGVDVTGPAGTGEQSSVRIRGARSNHTKVIIDGITMNDPVGSGGDGSFNFANLAVEDIEKIEVLRGPQSVLYGSDAIGGVIVITTKRGKGKPNGYVQAEGGSRSSFREAASVGGSIDWFDYQVSVAQFNTRGISHADRNYGNHEKDPYRNTSLSTKLGVKPFENLDIQFIFRGSWSNTEIDDGFGQFRGRDDGNGEMGQRNLAFRTQATLDLLDGLWEQKFGYSYSETLQTMSDDDWDSSTWPCKFESHFKGYRTKFDWQHNFYLHETNTLTFGIETEEESGNSWSLYQDNGWLPWVPPAHDKQHMHRKEARTWSYYIQDKIKLWDRLFVTAGVRFDDHEQFGTAVTWRIAPAFWIRETDTKFKAAYGTAFKAPTVYQLFGTPTAWGEIGNADLQPETSCGWEVGVEQYFFERKLGFEVVYFRNKFKNLIDFNLANAAIGFENRTSVHTSGVELSSSWQPNDMFEIEGSYTYLQARDNESLDELPRLPRHKFNIDATIHPTDQLDIHTGVRFVGGRFDNSNGSRWGLSRYSVWNAGVTWRPIKALKDNLSVYARFENAFNEQYEEVKGFGTPGCTVYGGLKFKF